MAYRSCLCNFFIVVALLSSYPLVFVLACAGRLPAGVCGMPRCTQAQSCPGAHRRNHAQVHTLQGLQSLGRECTAVACHYEGVAIEG